MSRRLRRSTDDSDSKTLHVGGVKGKFPNYITSTHLQHHFSEFEDEIEKAMILRDLETKESKGCGLVTFTSHEAAENAMSTLNGTKLRGKFPIFIKFAQKPSSLQSNSVSKGCCELFFRAQKGKLANYIHNGHIRDHFTEFESEIVSVFLARDETGKSKGYSFIKFTSHQVAVEAQRELHGSMLQGKFQLYLNMRRPPSTSASESASRVSQTKSSKEYQLQPEALNIEGLSKALTTICSQKNTTVALTGGNVAISGRILTDIEESWKEISKFVEQTLPVTRFIQVSYGCVKYLQVKHSAYLQELRKHCKVQIPITSSSSSSSSVTITLQGKKESTEAVLDKLKAISSMLHVEMFQMQCPNKFAKLWQRRWDQFSTENANRQNIMITFTTTQVSTIRGGKNTVTVLIVGGNQTTVQHLKTKVLKEQNSSNMTILKD